MTPYPRGVVPLDARRVWAPSGAVLGACARPGAYIPERSWMSGSPVTAWSRLVIVIVRPRSDYELGMAVTAPGAWNGARRVRFRPVGRLVRVGAVRPVVPVAPPSADDGLRPVPSGERYRIGSAPSRGRVTAELADALAAVFERFAREEGFTLEQPLEIRLARGFRAGSPGHGDGRAADIAAVSGQTLLGWKGAWDRAMAAAEALSDPAARAAAISAEQKRNLGYRLYKALQDHGGWRVDPAGWRPYRGVMQLFGPWTAREGPWAVMRIKDPTPYQRRRLADQHWVFQAHQDHIHVAR